MFNENLQILRYSSTKRGVLRDLILNKLINGLAAGSALYLSMLMAMRVKELPKMVTGCTMAGQQACTLCLQVHY
jgi:hypothetical protein